MTRIIEPEKGVVLVKLGVSEYGDIPVPPKDHDSLTWGEVVSINKEDRDDYSYLLGRRAHWRKYKDDLRIDAKVGDSILCLIEIKDILGTSYDTDSPSSN